jgi:hypothetical protein
MNDWKQACEILNGGGSYTRLQIIYEIFSCVSNYIHVVGVKH